MTPRRRPAAVTTRALAATALLLAAACDASGDGATPGAADSIVATSYDSLPGTGGVTLDTLVSPDAEAPAGDFVGTTEPTVRERQWREAALLHAVRTARHDGWERVVFEFRGAELPGYEIRYVTASPAQCGSGNPVRVAGGAYLVVRLHGTNAHQFDGERPVLTVEERDRQVGYPLLKQLTLTCDFEAEVEWVLGLAGRRPYRVLELQQPTRLVVDVQAAGGR